MNRINKSLKECTTLELINELINRPGVEHFARKDETEGVYVDRATICRSDNINIWHEAERRSE